MLILPLSLSSVSLPLSQGRQWGMHGRTLTLAGLFLRLVRLRAWIAGYYWCTRSGSFWFFCSYAWKARQASVSWAWAQWWTPRPDSSPAAVCGGPWRGRLGLEDFWCCCSCWDSLLPQLLWNLIERCCNLN
ncbi:hypothetical protein BRADI_1g00365v3 [Brachypodium distachyon]|uniref:Uncharacterized protein n=2 Tax=Brachypodium distachyon TaxID=15368 RepID=A0A2K2DHG2_BRADI|nr:hypothetical protein BRADI_1g00365v3 [Brachypodium distachyon]